MPYYPYQVEGARWLASRDHALLADEPGLGKTAQAAFAADLVCAENILVICPASVRSVWKNEMDKWSMFGHARVNVAENLKHPPQPGVNIVSYDILSRGFQKRSFKPNAILRAWRAINWDVVICDEAHFLKEPDSLRTRAILGTIGIHGNAKRLWLLTGTPMPNHPGELWALMAACGATSMSHQEFIDYFCETGSWGFSVGKPLGAKKETADELNKLLKGIMMRRYKKFVMPQLPPLSVDDYPVPIVPIKIEHFFEQALESKSLVKQRIKAQEDFINQAWRIATAANGEMDNDALVKVLEAAGPGVALYRRWLGSVKATSILPTILDELQNKAYEKVVIFAHHRQVINYLEAHLKKYNPVVITGATPPAKRELAVNTFQHDKRCKVFIGQIIAAGTGLTLTAAHNVIVLEQDWVPANNAQAIMRCHRIGQKEKVFVRFVRLDGSLDDYIAETLRRKTDEILRIVGG